MGKSGAFLRAFKDDNRTYTFTRKQLEEHDAAIRTETIRQRQQELKHQIDQNARAVFDEYIDRKNGPKTYTILRYALAISCKVLIEQFSWLPVTNRIDDRMRIVRFVKAVEEEVKDIEDNSDLKSYNQKVFDRYGVGFLVTEEGEKK